jgi:GGDEF domain-containing protein
MSGHRMGDALLRAFSDRTESTTDGGSVTKSVTIENLLGGQLPINH